MEMTAATMQARMAETVAAGVAAGVPEMGAAVAKLNPRLGEQVPLSFQHRGRPTGQIRFGRNTVSGMGKQPA